MIQLLLDTYFYLVTEMFEKEKNLDLNEIAKLVAPSPLRSFFSLGAKGLQGLGGGLAAGGLLFTVLAVAGITAAFVFEVITAVTGAVIFSALAIGLAAYQLYQQELANKKIKADFDQKLLDLRKTLIELIHNYQRLEDAKHEVEQEILRLVEMQSQITEPHEQESVEKRVKELRQEQYSLLQIRADLIEQVKIALKFVKGDNNVDRLKHLLGDISDAAIKDKVANYAVLHHSNPDALTIRNNINSFFGAIDLPIHHAKSEIFQAQFNALINPPQQSTHNIVKKVGMVLAGVGGMLGGIGAAVTIGALIFGGMAALITVGWPVAVIAIGVGLVTMTGALIYRRHVEKKQAKVQERLALAVSQATGISNFLNEQTNKVVTEKINDLNNRHQQLSDRVILELKVHDKSFQKYKAQIKVHTKAIRSYVSELSAFHTVKLATKHALELLHDDIKQDILLLTNLRTLVSEIVVIAGSEETKIRLLQEVDAMLKEAQIDYNDALAILKDVDIALHEQPKDTKSRTVLKKQPEIKELVSDNLDNLEEDIHPHS